MQNEILSIGKIRADVDTASKEYPIKKVTLFGSYADGTPTEKSDVDLLVEFNTKDVSLFMISGLRIRMEELLGKDVDIIHGPLTDDAMIEPGKEVQIYEA